ncbi:histone-lysine N-methyltransferase MECOM-like [Toxorhynchites rutilus septentrionalis]|uniref:histone-lysine N-methyltransferase MECOM-like n=1 Tax=Toxorhynchites rutilus septentrionalis TaxID=329112 RepID=UPI00247ADAB7|nr:histone-lysine N-methyltransferase MECOM-like [Toxorhynchites rutilus septentrionalis]
MLICRACGGSLSDPNVYQNLEEFVTIYLNLTGIELGDQEDPTKLKVCKECVEKLVEYDRFRTICLQVHWGLQTVKIELKQEFYPETVLLDLECKPLSFEKGSEKDEFSDDDGEKTSAGSDSNDDIENEGLKLAAEKDDNEVVQLIQEDPESTQSLDQQDIKSESELKKNTDISQGQKKKRAKWGSLKKREIKEPTKVYSCDRCPRKFKVLSRFTGHKRKHDGLKPFDCKICGKDFENWNNLKTHHIQKHTENKISLPCDHPGCDQVFATRQGLKRHRLRTHDPNYVIPEQTRFVCDTCGKTFSTNGILKKHKYSHAPDETPFVCTICSKKFCTSDKLRIHTMRHEGVKNHKCPFCGMRKTTMYEVKKHINNVHTKDRVTRTYPCDICPSVFSNSGNLNRHVNIVHLEMKPFVCTVCERAFGKSDHLKRHMKTHNRSSTTLSSTVSDSEQFSSILF